MKVKIIRKENFILTDDQISKIVTSSAKRLDLTGGKEVEILTVSKKEIAGLNSKYRGINQPTDVLSFPQQKIPGKVNILGSIAVCPEVVEEKNEIMSDVLKHGLLHLAGFDHETDAKKWDGAANKINCKL